MAMIPIEIVSSYQYSIKNWGTVKPQIEEIINQSELKQYDSFSSDRDTQQNLYSERVWVHISEVIDEWVSETGIKELNVVNMWNVKYEKGEHHPIHQHRGSGYSAIIYFDYDETIHTPTYYMNSHIDPVTEKTTFSRPPVKEGDVVIVPSSVLHYCKPNTSDTPRRILAFDMAASR
jgi:quercetin dioxygenase-like cupin family protein